MSKKITEQAAKEEMRKVVLEILRDQSKWSSHAAYSGELSGVLGQIYASWKGKIPDWYYKVSCLMSEICCILSAHLEKVGELGATLGTLLAIQWGKPIPEFLHDWGEEVDTEVKKQILALFD